MLGRTITHLIVRSSGSSRKTQILRPLPRIASFTPRVVDAAKLALTQKDHSELQLQHIVKIQSYRHRVRKTSPVTRHFTVTGRLYRVAETSDNRPAARHRTPRSERHQTSSSREFCLAQDATGLQGLRKDLHSLSKAKIHRHTYMPRRQGPPAKDNNGVSTRSKQNLQDALRRAHAAPHEGQLLLTQGFGYLQSRVPSVRRDAVKKPFQQPYRTRS